MRKIVGWLAAAILLLTIGGCGSGGRSAGQACVANGDCAPGLYCPVSTMVCSLPPVGTDARPGADAGDDAGLSCGDGACSGSESCASCPQDCGLCMPTCTDGVCDPGESCDSCPADCGACPPMCGDGTCDATETCASCLPDCGMCPAVCPNGACEPGESCASCPADCGMCPPTCPDGTCDPSEDCATCPMDCGACPVCGNGIPEGTEQCDDGLANSFDADCLPSCTFNVCGDGNLNTMGPMNSEQCDPPGGSCDAMCQVSAAACPQGVGGLVCGGIISGNNSMAGSTLSNPGYPCAGFSSSGPEVAYTFVSPVDQNVSFMLSGHTADLDFFVLSGPPDCAPQTCIAYSGIGGSGTEVVTIFATAGTPYYLLVDGYNGAISNFTLTAACEDFPPAASGTCTSPYLIDMPSAGSASYFIDTCGAGNDSMAPAIADCPGAGNGEDVVYQLDLGFAATVSIDLRDFDGSAPIDTVLYIRDDCASNAPGNQLACSNDINGQPRHSYVNTALGAGTYWVIVDNLNYTSGMGTTFICGYVRLVVQAS